MTMDMSSVPPPFPEINSSVNSPKKKFISWEKQPMGWVTKSLLIVCCLLLFFVQIQSQKYPQSVKSLGLFSSPFERALLFDDPLFLQYLDEYLTLYGLDGLQEGTRVPSGANQLIDKMENTPYWKGLYSLLVNDDWEEIKQKVHETPMFEKIQQGEVWRFVSPCLLHADIFHLLFNMLWLLVLGKQIEQRLKAGRYLIFIILVGAFSNTIQYLMTGPNFVGFSGVLCGMLAFIWVRQKNAPWEGYHLDRMTLIFMFVYILGMAGLQLITFLFEKTFQMDFSTNIANTAHLMGGIAGYFLGKFSFFSWRQELS
ncbi:MAG: rhomboid family intramembrane serine protease [Parachlamydiaceae bacterium]|nr:rhomboid family intramembrane serine protease [Parachlamydiaceae bacterium]